MFAPCERHFTAWEPHAFEDLATTNAHREGPVIGATRHLRLDRRRKPLEIRITRPSHSIIARSSRDMFVRTLRLWGLLQVLRRRTHGRVV